MAKSETEIKTDVETAFRACDRSRSKRGKLIELTKIETTLEVWLKGGQITSEQWQNYYNMCCHKRQKIESGDYTHSKKKDEEKTAKLFPDEEIPPPSPKPGPKPKPEPKSTPRSQPRSKPAAKPEANTAAKPAAEKKKKPLRLLGGN
ncbi:MAG: hypothetical protein AAF571_14675 [Verrucomicrobiota bacterium]